VASENVENYLKRIFLIEAGGGRVSTSSLSEKLQISPASVSEMVKRLADGGNVLYTPYKGVQLTEKGRRKALRIIRLHRLWELFLVKVLNYSWDEIHDEAELLEHITSEKLEQRLDAFLGYPTLDPHGDAIPTAAGVVNGANGVPLARAKAASVVVKRVSDEDPEILKYADRLGISINKVVNVMEKISFDGSFRVKIGGKEHFISAKLAENLFVEPVSGRKGKRHG
jgi:DtxR family Mn-dependent transcriptional regulator